MHRTLACWLLLGLALVAFIVVSSPVAVSAARDPTSGPKTLWQAFPLNPTGERIVSPISAPPGVLRPPVQEAAVAPATAREADTSFRSMIGGGVVALLAVVVLAAVLLRLASAHRRRLATPGHEEPSAYISAVFVGTRFLPVIEGSVRRRRRALRTADIVPVLVGSAIAVAIALLIVHYIG